MAAHQRGRGGGVAGLVHFFEFNLGRLFLPKNLSVGPVQRERDEPALGQAGEENALGRQHRRGKTGADFGLPSEVVAGRLDRWLAVPGQAGAVGAAVLVPLGAKRLAKREGSRSVVKKWLESLAPEKRNEFARKCKRETGSARTSPAWPSDGLIFFYRDETAGRLPVDEKTDAHRVDGEAGLSVGCRLVCGAAQAAPVISLVESSREVGQPVVVNFSGVTKNSKAWVGVFRREENQAGTMPSSGFTLTARRWATPG